MADGFRFFALVAPYCVLRLVALATTQDEGSIVHLHGHLSSVHNPRQVAEGLWSGFRIVWVFAALAPALVLTTMRAAWAGLLLLVMAATLAVNVPLAHDLSRSSSTMVPAAMLGVLLLLRARPLLARWALAAALALNLCTPAWHVIEGWDSGIPICSAYFELYRLNHSPPHLVGLYVQRASKLVAERKLPGALEALEAAVRIGPGSVAAQLNCGIILNALGRPAEAAVHFDAAVRIAPKVPEVYLARAQFRHAHGQYKAAGQDLRAALELLPEGSPARMAHAAEIDNIRRALGNP